MWEEFDDNGLETIYHHIQYLTGSLRLFFRSLTNCTDQTLAIICWKEWWEKYEMRWAASYFAPFGRLQREGSKWKWVDIKHHEQKWSSCRIILHFCMSGSVENKRWKLMQKITFVQKMLAIHENQTSNQVYAVDWLFNPTAFWTVNIFKWVQMRFYLQHRGKGNTIFGSLCPFS